MEIQWVAMFVEAQIRHCEEAKPTRQSRVPAASLDCRGALRLAMTALRLCPARPAFAGAAPLTPASLP